MAAADLSQPAPGYRVRKVNIQDPRYGSPNYRHVAVGPDGRVSDRKMLTRAGAIAVSHQHAAESLSSRQFSGNQGA